MGSVVTPQGDMPKHRVHNSGSGGTPHVAPPHFQTSIIAPFCPCLMGGAYGAQFSPKTKEALMRTQTVASAVVVAVFVSAAGTASAETPDWQKVGEALGKPGTE